MSLAVAMTNGLTSAAVAMTDAAASAVSVDFDKTVIGQIVLFLVLMLVLKPVLYDPMLKLFAEREERTEKTKERARAIDEESADALSKFENAMAKARAVADAEREKVRGEGVKTENEIMARVRASTAKVLDEGRKSRETQVQAVRSQLQGRSQEIARDVATRVLGREVQP